MGSGIVNMSRQLGFALGVAILVAVFTGVIGQREDTARAEAVRSRATRGTRRSAATRCWSAPSRPTRARATPVRPRRATRSSGAPRGSRGRRHATRSRRASSWPRWRRCWRSPSRWLCGGSPPRHRAPPKRQPPRRAGLGRSCAPGGGSRPEGHPFGHVAFDGRRMPWRRIVSVVLMTLQPPSSPLLTDLLAILRARMRAAAVGHVEWIEFARVERVPVAGEIVHAKETWGEPGGGGAVTAVQLAKLAGGATFFTALGDDELGHRVYRRADRLGLRVEAAWRDEPQRRGFVFVDSGGRAHDHRDRRPAGPERGATRWPGTSSRTPTPSTSPRATPERCAAPARPAAWWPRPVRWSRSPRPAWSWTRWCPAARTRASATSPACSTPSRGWWCAPPGPAAGPGNARAARRGATPRPPLPGPVEDSYGCGDSFAGGLDLRARRRDGGARGAGAGGPLRRRLPHRQRARTAGQLVIGD